MSLESRLRDAEARLFACYQMNVEESHLELADPGPRLRVLSLGTGPELVFLHGVGLTATAWLPLVSYLPGYRLHLVELPGHGFSGPLEFRPGEVREQCLRVLDGLFDALSLPSTSLVGHSLGGMLGLWYAAARPERLTSLVLIGDPAVILPGVIVKFPLSLMTLRWIGPILISMPTSRGTYRSMLRRGLGPAATAAMSGDMIDVLRLAARRRGNVRTVASLMHALNRFRHPRPESVLAASELSGIGTPSLFIWGRDDPFLSPHAARGSIGHMPNAGLHELDAGHAPWFEDPAACAKMIATAVDPSATE